MVCFCGHNIGGIECLNVAELRARSKTKIFFDGLNKNQL